MERLTARSPKNGQAYLVNGREDEQSVESKYPNTLRCIQKALERLAELEDMNEAFDEVHQGREK